MQAKGVNRLLSIVAKTGIGITSLVSVAYLSSSRSKAANYERDRLYEEPSTVIRHFERFIDSTSFLPDSCLSRTDTLLYRFSMEKRIESLSAYAFWLLHYKDVNQQKNQEEFDSVWTFLRDDVLNNQEHKDRAYRLTLASYIGYFQFLICYFDDKWIIYKPEQEWNDSEKVKEINPEWSPLFRVQPEQINTDLYNTVKHKYGELRALNKQEMTEFLTTLEKYVKLSIEKELLIDELVESKMLDKHLCGDTFEPVIEQLTWQNIHDYEQFDVVPLEKAQTHLRLKYDLDFEEEKMAKNFLFEYKEVESMFGYAKVFGHLLNSEIEMLKIEKFE